MSIFYSIAWQISLFKLISSFISPPQTFFCFLQLKQLKSLIFLVNNFTKNIFYPFLCIKKYPFDKSHRKIIDLSLFMKNIKKNSLGNGNRNSISIVPVNTFLFIPFCRFQDASFTWYIVNCNPFFHFKLLKVVIYTKKLQGLKINCCIVRLGAGFSWFFCRHCHFSA